MCVCAAWRKVSFASSPPVPLPDSVVPLAPSSAVENKRDHGMTFSVAFGRT